MEPGGPWGRGLPVGLWLWVSVRRLEWLHFCSFISVWFRSFLPLVNLIAAPLVSAATLVGAIGVIGPRPLITAGAWMADLVMVLAHSVSGWPQLGALEVLGVGVMSFVFFRHRRLRGVVALAGAGLIVIAMVGGRQELPDVGAVVLDVGQGDSILLVGGDGRFALIDGGPDPVRLIEKLNEYGIRALDLVVLTHVHADHAAGLSALVGRIPIGIVWAALEPHDTPGSMELLALLAEHGVRVEVPEVGQTMSIGRLELTVLGPSRRYASANDQSVVLVADGPGRAMLLVGDVEAVAQREMGGVTAEVLKVPHHGSGASDAEWLFNVGADLAVISVGANEFGHPRPWVIDVLEQSGAEVARTDQEGDIIVPLG